MAKARQEGEALGPADCLSAAARRAAEAAAVIGSEHALELLATVNGEDGIEALLASKLISEKQPGAAAFRTPRVRDEIYAAIPWTRRRLLHRKVAEALEARHGKRDDVAEHWIGAGEHERARHALLDGATRARQVHAHRETVQLLRRALDLWPPDIEESERLTALEQLGDAAQAAGALADAMRAWREVAESPSPGVRARALRKIANLHELNCEWSRVLDARLDAMAAFAAAGEAAEAAIEAITAGIRLRLSARARAGLEVCESAVAHADNSGREDLKLRARALKSNLEARLGDFAGGIAALRSHLDAAIALNNPALAGEIYQRLADSIERSSDFRAGANVNREGIAFCEERDAAGGIVACLACMSWILVRGGEWDQAVAACRRLLESSSCPPPARAIAIGLPGLVHVLRGEFKKGEPLLAESDALSRRLEHALMEFIARWGLAICDAANGAHDAAAEKCRAIVARWRQTDERHASMPILRWAATCFARVSDRESLRACADAFSEAAATFSHAEPLSGLAHVLGEIALLDGDAAKAVEQFEHAVTLLDGMQLPRERVDSQLRASVACAAAGMQEKAVAHARDAVRGAEKLGARPLVEAATRQLRSLGAPIAGALGPRGAKRATQAGLTDRQLQILGEISKGRTDKEIARSLRLSPRTVEMHVAHALSALDCRSRAEAVRKAGELGVLARRIP